MKALEVAAGDLDRANWADPGAHGLQEVVGISQHLVEALLRTVLQQDAVVHGAPPVVAFIQHLEPGQQRQDHFIVLLGAAGVEILHHSVAEDRGDLRAGVLRSHLRVGGSCRLVDGVAGSRKLDEGLAWSRRLDHAPVVLGFF